MFYRGKEAAFRLKVSGLEDYLNYLQRIEEVVSEKRGEVKRRGEEISEEDQDEYWYHNIDEFDNYDSVFPQILQKSIYTSLFGYFEHQLMEFCEDKEKLKYIPGMGLDKAKEYIAKHLGYTDLFNEEEWELINKYKRIRNCLAHAGGVVSLMKSENEQSEVRKFVKITNGIEISNEDEINLTSKFSKEFVETGLSFLTKVFYRIEKAP